MKKNFLFSSLTLLIGVFCILSYSCQKKDDSPTPAPVTKTPTNTNTNPTTATKKPSVTTATVGNITASSATCGGIITADGGSAITAEGVCWSTTNTPTVNNDYTTDGTGINSYISSITGLQPNTTYYVRAYATNTNGTAYGTVSSFKTSLAVAPCTPTKNGIRYNSQNLTYSSVYAGTNAMSYGTYGLVGNGTYSDLYIEFSEAPVTGRYTTVHSTETIGSNNCLVHGTFGYPNSQPYFAQSGGYVYVTQNGTNLYSVTFCNLTFSSCCASYVFSSDGNLTEE